MIDLEDRLEEARAMLLRWLQAGITPGAIRSTLDELRAEMVMILGDDLTEDTGQSESPPLGTGTATGGSP